MIANYPHNILIGPLFSPEVLGEYAKAPYIKTFINSTKSFTENTYDIAFDLSPELRFTDVLRQLPSNWQPDAIIWWDMVYQGIPEGIENVPYPTFGIPGDWNINYLNIEQYARAFDWIISDQLLINKLKLSDYHQVIHWPSFSFNPQKNYPIPDSPKLYDIAFIGNLEHSIHHNRYHYLKRLTYLNDRYKIFLGGGIYGEAYNQILNQSKIVFNHGVCQVMNMRAYEAPACKALLFMEEDNLEIRQFLVPNQECILYNSDNFESLLDYYLTHDQERENIAEAGYQKILTFSYEHQFENLLYKIARAINKPSPERSFIALNSHRKKLVIANQLFTATSLNSKVTAQAKLTNTSEDIKDIATLNALGFIFYTTHMAQTDIYLKQSGLKQALYLFKAAMVQQPKQAILNYHLALCHYELGDFDLALESFTHTLKYVAEEPMNSLRDFVLPFGYEQFSMEWQRSSYQMIEDNEARDKKYQSLLAHQSWFKMAEIYTKKAQIPQAIDAYIEAINCHREFVGAYYLLAQLYKQTKQYEKSLEMYEKSLHKNHFMAHIWYEFIDLLLFQQKYESALTYVEQGSIIWRTKPSVSAVLDKFRQYKLTLQLLLCRDNYSLFKAQLPEPFEIEVYQQFSKLQTKLLFSQSLKTLFEPLLLAWIPLIKEPEPEIIHDNFIHFTPEKMSSGIGQQQLYQRSYKTNKKPLSGELDFKQLPPRFPTLDNSNKINLSDLNQTNYLCLVPNFQSPTLIEVSQQIVEAHITTWLWSPEQSVDEKDFEWLEASLNPEANIGLFTEDIRFQEQASLLKTFELMIITEPTELAEYYFWWCHSLGIPAVTLFEIESPYPNIDKQELMPFQMTSLNSISIEAFKAHTEVLLQKITDFYQKSYHQRVLDSLWKLKKEILLSS